MVRRAAPRGPLTPGDSNPAAALAGIYGPDSEAWTLNREATLLLGVGPRALLLQIAHPLVAAGVAEHSDFRADPWRRLAGTLRSYLRIVYGSEGAARAEIARLNGLHASVRGEIREPEARVHHGSTYRARDPELSLWVHATLVDSTLAAFDAWIAPLSRERRGRFYEETLPVARGFGIPPRLLPPDLDAFEAYWAAMLAPSGPLRVGDTARELAAAILHPPLAPAVAAFGHGVERVAPALDAVPPAAYAWLLWPSIGLLPPSVRDAYGLAWGPRERLVSEWLVSAWRAWRPLLPPSFRQMPQALAADARVARVRSSR